MEGLEIKEKQLSEVLLNKDFRIDSQFHTQEPYKNRYIKYDKIGNLINSAQYGISIGMNENGLGVPIYRMNEIHNMLCDLDVSKHAEISGIQLDTFTLNDRDVLFNRTNSFEWVGRTGLYRKKDKKTFIFASYLVRFVPDPNKILPEYLTVFLNSKYGKQDIKRRARQSINQTNVNPEEVKATEIPLLSLKFQEYLKHAFDKSHVNIISCNRKYSQAEQILLEELNLSDFEPSDKNINIKSFKDSFLESGRLDAEYYQVKYDAIEKAFNNFERIALKNLVEYPISSGITPKAGGSSYTDKNDGIAFVRAVDLKNGEVNKDKFNYLKPSVHNGVLKRTKLIKDDVLFSIAGTVGRTAIFRHSFQANINQAVSILRFSENKVLRLYLVAFFNSDIGKVYVSKYSRQGLQTNLNLTEVGELNIPIIKYEKQQEIVNLIEDSFTLKKQSKELLEVAKRAVEIAIETDENTAMEYIKNKQELILK